MEVEWSDLTRAQLKTVAGALVAGLESAARATPVVVWGSERSSRIAEDSKPDLAMHLAGYLIEE